MDNMNNQTSNLNNVEPTMGTQINNNMGINNPVPSVNNNYNQNTNMEPKEKKGVPVPVLIIVLVVFFAIGFVVGNYLFGKTETPPTPNPNNNEVVNPANDNTQTNPDNSVEPNNNVEPTQPDVVTPTSNVTDSIFEVNVMGSVIKFPTTKEAFAKTGWKWDEKYATKKIDTGYAASGGRIGTYPGGVVVTVLNNSGEVKEIQNCVIDDGAFYNPKNGSEKVTFVGGLNYDSKLSEVKAKMTELGFKNCEEKKYDNSVYYKCFKDDNASNYRDYIEFYYSKDVINSVSIYTSGK